MAKYIVLANFTDQGIRGAKETVNRARKFIDAAHGMGVTVLNIHWTLGPYDLVTTIEAPDDQTLTRLGLALGMQGNVRTQTMRAFDESEMESIIKTLP